ncbi:peroxisomal membrane anchor protein conserved region domain-containing protein, partial [Trichoderma pleuroticola]
MDDSEGKSSPDGVPKWQLNAPSDNAAADAAADASQPQQDSDTDRLEVARRFLDDDAVKTAPRDTKVDFLKSKGVEDEDIEHLLGGLEEAPSPAKDSTPSDESNQKALQVLEKSFAPKPPPVPQPPTSFLAGSDRPPVVTYPEFLTKPQRTPPLVTTNGLLNTLYAFGGLSTFLYGASKFAVEPMIEKLTNARIDLHETTANRLDSILAQLESTVSVVPSYKSSANTASEATESEDPSEMFHRDVGTQTSFPSSPSSSSPKGKDEAQSKVQADRLSKLAKSLKGLTDDFKKQSNESQDIKVLLDVFRDDLDNMTYGHHAELFGNFDKRKKKDSEDEIRKVRDNIRRIKGVLLSARTFPTSA